MTIRRIGLREVRHTAELAGLDFSEEELPAIARELNDILVFMAQLDEVSTAGVEPAPYPYPMELLLREDEAGSTLPLAEALRNAPRHDETFVLVPGGLGGE